MEGQTAESNGICDDDYQMPDSCRGKIYRKCILWGYLDTLTVEMAL